ncbi:hypothetical protein C8R43DRAFT_1018304 [Mycena crocata]|nr:hypothetical protein C8R43DRAFT_1018304 [Mycena crocata]
MEGRTVVCGFGFGERGLGFKFDPETVRGALFPSLYLPMEVETDGDEEMGDVKDEEDVHMKEEEGEGAEDEDGADGAPRRKRRRVSMLDEVVYAAVALEGAGVVAEKPMKEEDTGDAMELDGKPDADVVLDAADLDADVTPTKRKGAAMREEPTPKQTPKQKEKLKEKEAKKQRPVVLETAGQLYLLSPAAVAQEGTGAELWDVARVESGDAASTKVRTLLYRALGSGDVELGREGVRFRGVLVSSASASSSDKASSSVEEGEVEMAAAAGESAAAAKMASRDADWGPRVSVMRWRFT